MRPEPALSIACCADSDPTARSRNSMLYGRILAERLACPEDWTRSPPLTHTIWLLCGPCHRDARRTPFRAGAKCDRPHWSSNPGSHFRSSVAFRRFLPLRRPWPSENTLENFVTKHNNISPLCLVLLTVDAFASNRFYFSLFYDASVAYNYDGSRWNSLVSRQIKRRNIRPKPNWRLSPGNEWGLPLASPSGAGSGVTLWSNSRPAVVIFWHIPIR